VNRQATSPAWLKRYETLSAQRIARFRRALVRIIRDRLEPLSFESVTEWAETNRYLPPTASEPGRYNANRCPYQRGIQDSFNIAGVREITVMAAERIGKSTIASNILGYLIDRRPTGVLWTMPSREAVLDFVMDEIRPMIRSSARLRRKVAARGSRDGTSSVRRISFQSGQVTFQGAGSSLQLAFRTVRVVVNDEVDKLKTLPGEGDADALLAKRVSTFGDEGMIIRLSKPTTEDRSRINRHFKRGSMSYYFLVCPGCGQFQHLRWAHIKFDDAKAECDHCHNRFDQDAWLSSAGEWRESNANPYHKSFQVSAILSPFIRWATLIEEFRAAHEALESGDPSLMTVFQNSRLGEVSGALGAQRIEAQALYDKRSYFGAAEVPGEKVIGVTLGIDTQSDGFRWLLSGWGRRNEVWQLYTGEIVGDMAGVAPWNELRELLGRVWYDEGGNAYKTLLSCLDVQGDHYERAIQFVKLNAWQRLCGVRGLGADKRKSRAQSIAIIRNEYQDKTLGIPIRNIDVDAAKTMIGTMLSRAESEGPGIVHFPCDETGGDIRGFNLATLAEFVSEYKKKKMVEGYPVYTWHKKADVPNHRLDCFVYSLAAKLLTRIDFDKTEPLRIKTERVPEYLQKVKELQKIKEQPRPSIQRPRRYKFGL
jgi:phage terminase large subunit GpA-like protein